MVEKVSKVNVQSTINTDLASDDDALLKQIGKKKKQKQGGENNLTAAILPPDTLVRLIPAPAQGGGFQKTEKQVIQEDVPTSSDRMVDTRQTNKGDSLRRKVASALAGQTAANVHNAGLLSGKNMHAATVTTPEQPVTAQHSSSSPADVANPVAVNNPASGAETGYQESQQRKQDDSGEASPLWQGVMQTDRVLAKRGETTTQNKNVPATLQQLKTQATPATSVVKEGNEGQMLEMNYSFQRWSGEHSVRISVPAEARREGSVTLLPSDSRAADVLLRNMGHLTGRPPDLLWPQQEHDEQQQRRQQQQQDEDQE